MRIWFVMMAFVCMAVPTLSLAGSCEGIDKTLSVDGLAHARESSFQLNRTEKVVLGREGAVGRLCLRLDTGGRDTANRTIEVPIGSGVLVDDSVFLTAYHCLDLKAIRKGTPHDLALALQRLEGPDWYRAFSVELSVSSGKQARVRRFDCGGILKSDPERDYAFILLNGRPGLAFPPVPKHKPGFQAGDSLILIHFPRESGKSWGAGSGTRLAREWTAQKGQPVWSIYYRDIETDAGSSGAPIFNLKGDLVGIHLWSACTNGSATSDPDRSNGGLFLEGMYPFVR